MSLRILGFTRFLPGVAVVLSSSAGFGQTLSSEDAVARAARGNPALRAAMHDAAAAAHAFDAAERAQVPTYFANVEGQYAEQLTPIRLSEDENTLVTTDAQAVSTATGVRYTSPIGTAIEVGLQAATNWRTQIINPIIAETIRIGPTYSGQLYANMRQPLLQGAGTDAVMAPVTQAETARTISERERDQQASQLVADVLGAYWELWYAQQAVAVQEDALAVAERQYEETRIRVEELGTAARSELLQYATDRAAIQEQLALARRARATSAVELGRLLGTEPSGALGLVAAGEPQGPARAPSLDKLYAAARESSPRLRTLEAQVELARQRVEAAKDQDQPRLDLLISSNMGGLWLDDNLPGLRLPNDRPAFTGIVGLEFEVPMGPRVASAQLAQAREELNAAEARYEAEAEAVEAQVAAFAIQLEAAAEQVELARQTAELAAELAETEKQRLELGTATPDDVVRAQQRLREAELRHRRAIVDQANIRNQLEHQVGGLLYRFADVFREQTPSKD